MRLFRSEDHIDRWLQGRERGAVLSIERLGELAYAWWSDRLSDDWRPRSTEQNQVILAGLGLTGPFWQLG